MNTDRIDGFDPANVHHYGRGRRRAVIRRVYTALLEDRYHNAAAHLRNEPSLIEQGELARQLADEYYDGWIPDKRWEA